MLNKQIFEKATKLCLQVAQEFGVTSLVWTDLSSEVGLESSVNGEGFSLHFEVKKSKIPNRILLVVNSNKFRRIFMTDASNPDSNWVESFPNVDTTDSNY